MKEFDEAFSDHTAENTQVRCVQRFELVKSTCVLGVGAKEA